MCYLPPDIAALRPGLIPASQTDIYTPFNGI